MVERRTIWRWVAAACALLLLLLLPESWTFGVKGVFRNAVTPLQSGFLKSTRSLKAGLDSVRGFGGLAEENRGLRKEIVKLQADLRYFENVEKENEQLRKLLEFHGRRTDHLIPAEIAARSISGWWQSVRLAKGADDGISPDRAVISQDGLIGRTMQVSSHTSEVLLLSDPACRVSARVSRTGSPGLVVGRGVDLNGYPVVRMRFIFKDAPIQVGDEVVTSGLGGVFPRDILIGDIESVQMEEGGLYKTADILPKAVYRLTDVIFVMADPEEVR